MSYTDQGPAPVPIVAQALLFGATCFHTWGMFGQESNWFSNYICQDGSFIDVASSIREVLCIRTFKRGNPYSTLKIAMLHTGKQVIFAYRKCSGIIWKWDIHEKIPGHGCSRHHELSNPKNCEISMCMNCLWTKVAQFSCHEKILFYSSLFWLSWLGSWHIGVIGLLLWPATWNFRNRSFNLWPYDNIQNGKSLMMTNLAAASEWHVVMLKPIETILGKEKLLILSSLKCVINIP